MRLRYKGRYRYRISRKIAQANGFRNWIQKLHDNLFHRKPQAKPEWICVEHWVRSGYQAGQFINRLLRLGIKHFEVHVNEPKRIFGIRHA